MDYLKLKSIDVERYAKDIYLLQNAHLCYLRIIGYCCQIFSR